MKKTYYVISHSSNEDPRWYLTVENYGTVSLQNAEQYAMLPEAMEAAVAMKSWLFKRDGSKKAHGNKWAIIRVDEELGAAKRVISKRTHLDATKPCVVSIQHPDQSAVFSMNARLDMWSEGVHEAHVFPALDDALQALNQRDALSTGALLKIHNVREEPAEATITLTVVE